MLNEDRIFRFNSDTDDFKQHAASMADNIEEYKANFRAKMLADDKRTQINAEVRLSLPRILNFNGFLLGRSF
jgi:hypothetical protein